MNPNSAFEDSLQAVKKNHRELRQLSTDRKNAAIKKIATTIETESANILSANNIDLNNLSPETTPAFRDRLTLNPERIKSIVQSLHQVAALEDPVGEVVEEKVLINGLQVKRVRAPLGVILMIFESRPNVILEAFSLAFKSGNSIILRGGSDSRHTSQVLYKLMNQTLASLKVPLNTFYGIENYDRKIVEELLKRKDLIDVVVPRGGEQLIEFVQDNSLMPIIKNDRGLCHAYVDEDADIEMAVKIIANGKVQRPGVCNSLETVLVHKKLAPDLIPKLDAATAAANLRWRADAASLEILGDRQLVRLAQPEDWDTEYLDLILNCRVVENLDQALDHIEKHGSRHSEVIVTRSEAKARRFQAEVDAAVVYWNASTRFTDGFELGLGGELGISTQKLHVRGPVGLRELTSLRWVINGSGQVR